MTKYLEIGFGNRWFMRTEFEDKDETGYEVKGWVKPVKPQSFYIRIWLGSQVFILDSREGLKTQRKSHKSLKIIFGICSKGE